MILFSAPFDFFEAGFKKEVRERYPIKIRQIDAEADLYFDDEVTQWIPNPGQSFLASENVLRHFPNLKVISTPSTGSNHIDIPYFEKRGIAVRSLLHNRPRLEQIRASSEFTLLLLLASLRKIDVAFREVQERRWRHNEDQLRGNEVFGKKIGIVGMGRNGSNLRRWLESMEAEVCYFDPYRESGPGRLESLREIFTQSDIVVLTCVLTDETKGMITREHLVSMKKGAHLINTSRGEIVREKELSEVLNQRPDLSFAADVLTGEVQGQQFESPLYNLCQKGRIILTPHIAGASMESQTKAALGALENLGKYEN